jgi:hypothetical protein
VYYPFNVHILSSSLNIGRMNKARRCPIQTGRPRIPHWHKQASCAVGQRGRKHVPISRSCLSSRTRSTHSMHASEAPSNRHVDTTSLVERVDHSQQLGRRARHSEKPLPSATRLSVGTRARRHLVPVHDLNDASQDDFAGSSWISSNAA